MGVELGVTQQLTNQHRPMRRADGLHVTCLRRPRARSFLPY